MSKTTRTESLGFQSQKFQRVIWSLSTCIKVLFGVVLLVDGEIDMFAWGDRVQN